MPSIAHNSQEEDALAVTGQQEMIINSRGSAAHALCGENRPWRAIRKGPSNLLDRFRVMSRQKIAMLAAAVLACTSVVDSVVMDRAAAFSASPHALLSLSLRPPANTCWTGRAAVHSLAARGWALAPSRVLQEGMHPNLLLVSRGRGPRLRRWQGRNHPAHSTGVYVHAQAHARERHTLDQQHARLTQ